MLFDPLIFAALGVDIWFENEDHNLFICASRICSQCDGRIAPEQPDVLGLFAYLVQRSGEFALICRSAQLQIKIELPGRTLDRKAVDLDEVDTAANKRPESI